MNQKEMGDFHWRCQPEANELVHQLLSQFVKAIPKAHELSVRMLNESGTRLIDWVDHFCLRESHHAVSGLRSCGFKESVGRRETLWTHEGGMFPAIRVGDFDADQLAVKTDSVAQFLFQHQIGCEIAGSPLSQFRSACVADVDANQLWVVERHGAVGFQTEGISDRTVTAVLRHREAFLRRRRDFADDRDGFAHAEDLIRDAVDELGVDWTCDLFFDAEREYWQSRNRAARIQKSRQDLLGLGWANHDHHTYRSSREHFKSLILLLESLGFQCRERFYGGAQAGWGAQVLEQPTAGIVIFADVDLTPTELTGDFAHEGLPPREELGTVGLWCKLHGEAILQAGMHHLECQFDFDAARQQLSNHGIKTMQPFTDFDHLKQAFTEGETWQVPEHRLENAVNQNWITETQVQQFRSHGGIGSHLEILQREEGYKGFNQTGISEIIRETDPRRATEAIAEN